MEGKIEEGSETDNYQTIKDSFSIRWTSFHLLFQPPSCQIHSFSHTASFHLSSPALRIRSSFSLNFFALSRWLTPLFHLLSSPQTHVVFIFLTFLFLFNPSFLSSFFSRWGQSIERERETEREELPHCWLFDTHQIQQLCFSSLRKLLFCFLSLLLMTPTITIITANL